MQVNLSPLPCSGAGIGAATGLLLSQLTKSSGAGSIVEAEREEREKRERRAEEDPRLMAGGIAGRGPTEAIQDDERRMRPTSRAAQSQVRADIDQKAAQQRSAFEKSLADATVRQTQRNAATSTAQQPETNSKQGGSTGTRTDSPAKDAADGNSKGSPSASKSDASPNADRPANQSSADTQSKAALTTSGKAVVDTGGAARAEGRASSVSRVTALRATTSLSTTSKPAAASESRSTGGKTAVSASQKNVDGKSGPTATRATRNTEQSSSKSDANIERILRVVRGQITKDRATATIRLDPPELGRIKLHLDLRQDALSLRIDTQTGAARRLLSEQIESLRQGLEAAGVHLERVEIREPAAAVPGEQADVQQESDAQPGERDAAADGDAEHPAEAGTDSYPALQDDTTERELISEPATESLVNILA